MKQCRICGSYAINPTLHGRDNTDLDLCDVCYWRKRAIDLTLELRLLRKIVPTEHEKGIS